MNKYESIFCLKSPKLLNDIIAYSNNDQYIVNVDSIINEQSIFISKSEKLNKNSYKDFDYPEEKKTKNKQKKKARAKIYLDKNVADLQDELEFNDINNGVFTRNVKNIKSKKNYKDNIYETIENAQTDIVIPKSVYLDDLLTVQELASKLNISTTDIIKWLFLQGISVTINQSLDLSISTLVAEHYSFTILKEKIPNKKKIIKQSDEFSGRLRSPIITLLGHVDHGKTSLLNAIRENNVVIKEAGNITQAIGSYELFVERLGNNFKLILLDTPGHEAFVRMRERGADITDIVILVIAADDGLKPQTIEAIQHVKNRNLPFIVAINKVDKPEANVSRVKNQLLDYGIFDKDAYNNKIIIEVSSLSRYNIDLLIDSLIDLSKYYGWKSNPLKKAEGIILEAFLDKKKGPIAQLLVQNGTLFLGDIIVAGNMYGKVKALQNNLKQSISKSESTSLVDALCFAKVPVAGLPFIVCKTEKEAKFFASQQALSNKTFSVLNNRISLDEVQKKGLKKIVKRVNLIIKTKTQGSIDAIMQMLSSIPQDKVQINLLAVSCGEVSMKDVELAITSNSLILVFGLKVPLNILQYLEDKHILISEFYVIYDLIDYVKMHMLQFVDVEYTKNILGNAVIKNLFTINKGIVAGCFVQSGKLQRYAKFELRRNDNSLYVGTIDSLKRVKQDVAEVYSGNECGILCKDYTNWDIGNSIECYDLQPLDKTL
uniref:Translation initiation factor IF-2, chloroplastic n=1 Tax=Porolithon onkodes TaxID=231751 RepID=A0A2Z2KYU6_9FLOR|nr:translation initiation factor IF-2 [Porolithon onkodes]ASB29751.1 translation initiation factor IF-2 [Porolithon onkodes]